MSQNIFNNMNTIIEREAEESEEKVADISGVDIDEGLIMRSQISEQEKK
jgi:hypothetical protein